MKTPLFFSAKSIGMSKRGDRKPQPLLVAAKHNLRELQAESGGREHISMELSHLNTVLHGPSKANAIEALAQELKVKYAVPKRKLRKDHVQALEFVISVRSDSDVDTMAYFRASTRWLIGVFGEDMLLNAVVHYDEAEPHMHALVLPIVEGQYMGGAAIDMTNLPKLIKQFADTVGKSFGLTFERKSKLDAAQRTAAFNSVIDCLKRENDPVITSRIWGGVVRHLMSSPQEYLEILGLQMPSVRNKGGKTMAQIFTSTGKKTSEDRDRSKTHDLSCVGQRNFTAPFSTPEPVDEAA